MRFCMYAFLTIILGTSLGCKLIAEVSVNMTELLARTDKDLSGDLYIEVPRCSDYSDVLFKVRKSIPEAFRGAKYVECFKKNFDSLAHFKIPIDLRRNTFNMGESPNINLIFSNENELMVGLPRSLRKDMEQMMKDVIKSLDAKDMNILGSPDMKFNITVKNDTGNDFKFMGIAIYINDDYPYTYNEARSISGNSFVITLSDVSIRRAMKYGTTTLFRKLD